MTVTEPQIRALLNTIIDPCSRAAGAPVGLDDLGLVRRVEITGPDSDQRVRVVVGVTEWGCMMGAAFLTEASKLLETVVMSDRVIVDLDTEFDWVPEDMSDGYLAILNTRHAVGRAHLRPDTGRLPLIPMRVTDR